MLTIPVPRRVFFELFFWRLLAETLMRWVGPFITLNDKSFSTTTTSHQDGCSEVSSAAKRTGFVLSPLGINPLVMALAPEFQQCFAESMFRHSATLESLWSSLLDSSSPPVLAVMLFSLLVLCISCLLVVSLFPLRLLRRCSCIRQV